MLEILGKKGVKHMPNDIKVEETWEETMCRENRELNQLNKKLSEAIVKLILEKI
jgi:hypothetical protein